MNVYPEFLPDGDRQLRIWRCDRGFDLLVLPGLYQGAAARARQLAKGLPDRGIVVVDMMSAYQAQLTTEETAKWLAGVLAHEGMPGAIVSFDKACELALEVRRALGLETLPIFSFGGTEPAPQPALERMLPVGDGSHLVSMWQYMRDASLLAPGSNLARREGMPFPTDSELHESFLEFAEQPAVYAHAWRQLGDRFSHGHADWRWVTTLEQLRDSLPEYTNTISVIEEGARRSSGQESRQYVATKSGYFHVRQFGKTGHPVIVLQSAPGSSAPMSEIGRRLSPRFRALCPDFLGNGESSKPERIPDIAQIAAEIVELADALGLQRFHLLGTHTGAKVALAIAESNPERVMRIVLDGLSLMKPEMRSDVLEHYLPPLIPDRWGTHLLQAWNMRRDMFLFWPWYRQQFEAARTIGIPSVEDLHAWTMGLLQSGTTYDQSYRAAFLCDARPYLSKIRHPVMLSVGEADMFAKDLDEARSLLPAGAEIRRTECTAWYPGQPPELIEKTVASFEAFLMDKAEGLPAHGQ